MLGTPNRPPTKPRRPLATYKHYIVIVDGIHGRRRQRRYTFFAHDIIILFVYMCVRRQRGRRTRRPTRARNIYMNVYAFVSGTIIIYIIYNIILFRTFSSTSTGETGLLPLFKKHVCIKILLCTTYYNNMYITVSASNPNKNECNEERISFPFTHCPLSPTY